MKSILRSFASGLIGVLVLTGGVLAEGAHSDVHDSLNLELPWLGQSDDETMSGGGPSIQQLSPGNRQIAESLFRAQGGRTGSRSLEQIAAAKIGGASWSTIFRQMKRDGLLRAATLGQAISAHNDSRRGAPMQDVDRGMSGKAPAFEQLSPGNQKIAMSLFAAQKGDRGIRSLEEIASAKSDGTRWSTIFNAMKADGLVAERNLGQVITKHAGSEGGNDGSETTDDEIVVRSPARLYADARIRAINRSRAAALAPKSRIKPVARAPMAELVELATTSDPTTATTVAGKRTAGKGPGTRYLRSLRPQGQTADHSGPRRLASSQDGETAKP